MKNYSPKTIIALTAFLVFMVLMLICLPFAYKNASKQNTPQIEQVEEVDISAEQTDQEETSEDRDAESDNISDEEPQSEFDSDVEE